jgi:hypothetical protein
MAFDREGAKAAGYTDAEIEAYIAANPEVASAPPATGAEPPPPEKIYTEPGSDSMVNSSTLGMAAAAVPSMIAPAAVGAASAYFGPKVIRKGAEMIRNMRNAPGYMEPETGPVSNRPVGPIEPDATRTRVPINQPINQPGAIEVPQNTGGQPRPGTTRLPSGTMAPVQPTVMPQQPKIGGPAAAEGANFIENISKKYLPAAGRAFTSAMETPVGRAVGTGARILGSAPVLGAQLALTPSSTGPAVPQTGPLRGSEINPATRRPWTAQELAQYAAQYK